MVGQGCGEWWAKGVGSHKGGWEELDLLKSLHLSHLPHPSPTQGSGIGLETSLGGGWNKREGGEKQAQSGAFPAPTLTHPPWWCAPLVWGLAWV